MALTLNGLHAGDVSPHDPYTANVFDLACRQLEAKIKQLFGQLFVFLAKLFFGKLTQSRCFHRATLA